jgi:hypothetical protein
MKRAGLSGPFCPLLPLDAGSEAFSIGENRQTGAIKVVLEP